MFEIRNLAHLIQTIVKLITVCVCKFSNAMNSK